MDQLDPDTQTPEPEQSLPQEPVIADAQVPSARILKTFQAFRHRNYRLFFSGQIVSLTGTWIQSVAQGWLVYDLTHSARLLGTVNAIGSLPILFFCLLAGVVADRFSKRDLVILTQMCAMLLAFTLAMLVRTDVVTVYHIMGIALLLGVVQSFDIPTRQSFVVEMVGKEDLSNAIALNSVTFNSARILGPAVAGIVIAKLGIEAAFFLNGFSFIPVIIGLGMMRVQPVIRRDHEPARQQLGEGFRFIRRHEMIWPLLLLAAVVSIFTMPYAVLMPIFARDVLHSGAKGLGYLVSSIGLGALIGAFVLSSLGNFKAKGKLLMAGNLVCCLMLVLFSFSRTLPVSMILLVGVGWGMMTNMALTNTLIQTASPDGLRGRVMSVYVLFHMGMGPVGAFQAGNVAQWLGAPWAVRIGVVVSLAAALLLGPKIIRHEKDLYCEV